VGPKLLCLALAVLAVAFAASYTVSATPFVLTLGLVRFARVPVGYPLSGLRPALWLLVAFVLLAILFYQPVSTAHAPVLLALGPARVTTVSLRATVVGLVRVVTFLLLIGAYTLTTRTADMARACSLPFGGSACPGARSAWCSPSPCASCPPLRSSWRSA
jgi:energy-coupling factor transport system permease protein